VTDQTRQKIKKEKNGFNPLNLFMEIIFLRVVMRKAPALQPGDISERLNLFSHDEGH
jgi:hypothetical protein